MLIGVDYIVRWSIRLATIIYSYQQLGYRTQGGIGYVLGRLDLVLPIPTAL
jgi:hypothetical protein